MSVNLIHNNTSENLIAFVKKGQYKFYCLAEVEYWIAEWWDGYVDLSKGKLEDLYFEFLDRFKLEYLELKKSYYQLCELGDQFKLDGNKPALFIDFDTRQFKSNFYDQSLENRMPSGWTGSFGEVLESIPSDYKYWSVKDKKSA